MVIGKDVAAALEPGDTLTAGTEKITVETVEDQGDGYYLVNDEYSLWPVGNGMQISLYDSVFMEEVARLNLPVTDSLVFLDEINPETGEILPEDTQHTAAEFLAMLTAADSMDPGFATGNVKVSFDADGQLVQIHRLYVPWQ